MNVRKAINILVRYRTIKEEITKAEQDYKKLCDEIDWIASIPSPVQQMTGMPGSGKTPQTTEDYAIRRLELGRAYLDKLNAKNNKVLDLMRFKFTVEDALMACTTMEEDVVRRRWLDKQRMVKVAEDLNISIVTAYRYQWKAFDRIEEAFQDEDVKTQVDASELDETEKEMMT